MRQNILIKRVYFQLIWIFFFLLSCQETVQQTNVPTVEVKYQDGHAQLVRNGLPYHIKGASGTQHLEKVALYGGNSIRTWSLHNAKELLDEAHEYGLTVTLGLEIGRPYWGEDFNYWNLWKVNKKIEELRPYIEEFKDHPALLMWGVGNEVALAGGPRYLVYYVINRVAKMVKEVDPNHPVMTALNSQIIGRVKYLMPDVDIIGYNGFSLIEEFYSENKNYTEKGWQKAYIFSEWGPPGHWEVKDTEWGAPYEMNTSEKIYFMEKYWDLMNQDSVAFLGSYAFYWGNKHEITHTWFSYFSREGLEAETVHFLNQAWTGETIQNSAPILSEILINDKKPGNNTYLTANSLYEASTFAFDSDSDTLAYKWEIRPEESSFYEVSAYQYNIEYLLLQHDSDRITFIAPKNEGPYRLFVFVSDDEGNFATQNIPFYVVNR